MNAVNQQEFNKYCAEVVGFTISEKPHDIGEVALWCKKPAESDTDFDKFFSNLGFYYNPYNDLNQMAEVIEKLLDDHNIFIDNQKCPNKYMIIRVGFKQSFRNFIISTVS